jgi:hypothetical protein
VAHADEGYGYETMFVLNAAPGAALDVDAIRDHLETIGDSVLVAGDQRALKVHVHNERPDLVLGFGLTLGTISRITVENLDNQARDVREERAAIFTGDGPGRHEGPAGGGDPAAPGGSAADASPSRVPLGVVVVVAGDGLREVFDQFRVSDQLAVAIVPGGQTSNPSTGELLDAVSSLPCDEVIVLPNNPNVVLAARQVAGMADRPTHVVPTRNAAEGVAALIALDPSAGAAANVEPMTRAGRDVASIAVTEAVRDAKIGKRKVRKGQTIVLDPDDGLVAADADRLKAILAALATFKAGYELVTIYYGDGADLDEAEVVARALGTVAPGADVQLVHGGQPYYRYLISVE